MRVSTLIMVIILRSREMRVVMISDESINTDDGDDIKEQRDESGDDDLMTASTLMMVMIY